MNANQGILFPSLHPPIAPSMVLLAATATSSFTERPPSPQRNGTTTNKKKRQHHHHDHREPATEMISSPYDSEERPTKRSAIALQKDALNAKNFTMESNDTQDHQSANNQPNLELDSWMEHYHTHWLYAPLSAMLICSHVLELSAEIQFTAAVLLHRHVLSVLALSHASQSHSQVDGSATATKTMMMMMDPDHHHPERLQEHQISAGDDFNKNDSVRHARIPQQLLMEQQQQQQQDQLLPTRSDIWMEWVAACLMLACKRHEELRRMRDFINCTNMISWQSLSQSALVQTQAQATEPQIQQHHSVQSMTPKNIITNNNNNSNNPETRTEIVDDMIGNTSSAITPATASSCNGSDGDQQKQKQKHQHAMMPVLSWIDDPPTLNERYWHAKARLVRAEQIVLRHVKFDVLVSSPHRSVVVILNELQQQEEGLDSSVVGASRMRVQPDIWLQLQLRAYQRLNNAIFYLPALQHDVMSLAQAAVWLALLDDNLDNNNDDDNNNNIDDVNQTARISTMTMTTRTLDQQPERPQPHNQVIIPPLQGCSCVYDKNEIQQRTTTTTNNNNPVADRNCDDNNDDNNNKKPPGTNHIMIDPLQIQEDNLRQNNAVIEQVRYAFQGRFPSTSNIVFARRMLQCAKEWIQQLARRKNEIK